MSRLVAEADLIQVLRRINALRHGDAQGEWGDCHAVAEEIVEAFFGASHRLAVYGSLAPGQSNHQVLAHLAGQWLPGKVHGTLYDRGWGGGIGFPGLIWEPAGPQVDVQLFVCAQLPENWARLDAFEGTEYRRILTPVYNAHGLLAVANIYELRHQLASDEEGIG